MSKWIIYENIITYNIEIRNICVTIFILKKNL